MRYNYAIDSKQRNQKGINHDGNRSTNTAARPMDPAPWIQGASDTRSKERCDRRILGSVRQLAEVQGREPVPVQLTNEKESIMNTSMYPIYPNVAPMRNIADVLAAWAVLAGCLPKENHIRNRAYWGAVAAIESAAPEMLAVIANSHGTSVRLVARGIVERRAPW